MRDIFCNWRFYRAELLLEGETSIPPYVKAWAEKNNFTLLPTSKDARGILGSGAQGEVYSMDKDGREFAVKFTTPFGREVDNEYNILQKIKNIQEKDSTIKRHTVNIFSIEKFPWVLKNKFEGGEAEFDLYVYVVERLSPLSKVEKKYFEELNIEKTKFLNNIFFDKGYKGWGKVRKVFEKTLDYGMNKLVEKYKSMSANGELPGAADDNQGLIAEKIKKIAADLLYAFDKTRNGLSRGDLETNKIFVDFFENPSIVHKKNLREFYAARMLETDSGRRFLDSINRLFDNKLDNKLLLKEIIYPILDFSFEDIFKISIPLNYEVGEDKFGLQKSGPLKSLHQALMRLRNKFGIIGKDIHEDNVMKRGDDLVIADLGFFGE